MFKYLAFILIFTFTSACSDYETEQVRHDPNEFDGGIISEEMKSAMENDLELSVTGNDSPADKLEFQLHIKERHYSDMELAIEYCKTLPDTSKITKCIESAGVSSITEEQEELANPVRADLPTDLSSMPLNKSATDCNYIWLSTWSKSKVTDYILYSVIKMWISTSAFLGSANDPDTCNRQPYKVSDIKHIGKAFNDWCRRVYSPSAGKDVLRCSEPGKITIQLPRNHAKNVSSIESYKRKRSTFSPTSAKCRLLQVGARNFDGKQFAWGGAGVSQLNLHIKTHHCKGKHSDYSWLENF